MIRLDRRITIEKLTSTQEQDYGSDTTSWDTYQRTHAMVDILNGNENYQAERKTGVKRAMFTIRFNPKTEVIDTTYRIQYRGQIWDILSAFEDTSKVRRQYLKIEAEQKGIDHAGV